MTISYNWLSEYLPEKIEPERLSRILTSIGLEVESLETYENIKGGLKGLVIGQVLECEKHPGADKLSVTKVTVGNGEPLQIVCGAPNVAAGQKVIVAKVGTTIHPISGEPLTMKVAKIRGVESHGMICAEDEIGIGESHAGIMVLSETVKVGTAASDYFGIYTDHIFEIGLTPNRMDAMSHMGVAKDVCAYLSHHNRKKTKPVTPFVNAFKPDNNDLPIKVTIENTEACQRYAGVSIKNVTIKPSPEWLQNKLKAIGLRPISNIVDITNYVLHETGQPLHAFDADAITGSKIIVKNLPAGTIFKTLDDKDRVLTADDLMICNEVEGMCIGGVFGGIKSGVKEATKNIFLESAWFNPVNIRRTSVQHGLRTDAATRFEKGVDISNTVNVLKRAALLIKEIAGGEIASDVVDVYPDKKDKVQVAIKYHYLKKLSGKNYHQDSIKNILESLGFEIVKEGMDEIRVAVPFSKPDISLPADIVEEIIRIDGLDNIEIPKGIYLTPSNEGTVYTERLKEKMADYLVGLGFHEILTNSITNSKYYNEEVAATTVKMVNNLSADLDVLRPSMLETGLESIAYNINRKNNNLRFFEFGKIYFSENVGVYKEEEHFSVFITGNNDNDNWRKNSMAPDFFTAKGIAFALCRLCGLSGMQLEEPTSIYYGRKHNLKIKNNILGTIAEVSNNYLQGFDIKQPVYFIDFYYAPLINLIEKQKIVYKEVSKFPAVQRDIALVVEKAITFAEIEKVIKKLNLSKLQEIKLFDVFESDKLGADKKSLAINFTFLDEEKTLIDKETDNMMQKIMQACEKELNAVIRK
ncbi:phenylalanine--tRNA ligase subunit beta [Panacibacter ginsenosidivorans]|uniref:Phenylalanine--tRNA ligase beta subunit n=1 Tax=Panacibacter ginsenosidivorans TaxID=1813871 RepID=A0A5B8V8Z3_9BACT|nr:phenylalanine--tRNA ligase subunit beta [Panacibacter ginsenosidivorans]QEC67186.1 phenylalanine--tRNA ligase subunit beta [Panacibacter ginsenosidivorans]